MNINDFEIKINFQLKRILDDFDVIKVVENQRNLEKLEYPYKNELLVSN